MVEKSGGFGVVVVTEACGAFSTGSIPVSRLKIWKKLSTPSQR